MSLFKKKKKEEKKVEYPFKEYQMDFFLS